jgi:ABC-2 type transport system permease protein
MSFVQLFLANLKILYRDRSGFFWNILLPAGIYIALSLLPIGKFLNVGTAYSTFLLPGIIAFVIMQGGIYTLAYWMIDLRGQGVIKRFMATPIKKSELVLSVIASRLVVMLLQVILLSLIGAFLFHVTFAGNILSIIILVILGGGIFQLVGLFISTVADTYQSAAPITAAVGLPLTFLSNIFYPVDNLPGFLQTAANALPITWLADGLRQLYLYPFDITIIWKHMVVLLAWFLIALGVILWRFKLEE